MALNESTQMATKTLTANNAVAKFISRMPYKFFIYESGDQKFIISKFEITSPQLLNFKRLYIDANFLLCSVYSQYFYSVVPDICYRRLWEMSCVDNFTF